MSLWIEVNEGIAARRRVPCRLFTSDGTSPDTGALNDAVIMGVNSLTTISLTSTLRAVEAAQGMYCVELTQSETSVLGTHPLYHTAGDFPQHVATVQVVNSNPFSTLSALDISALTALGVTRLDSNVTLRAATHSGATIQGVTRVNSNVTIANADYSAVTVRVDSGATIAGVTNVQTQITALNDIDGSAVTLHAGTHSNVTLQGVTRVNSSVTVGGVGTTPLVASGTGGQGYGA